MKGFCRKSLKNLALSVAAIATTGCMSSMPPVSERDMSGSYDGTWTLTRTMNEKHKHHGRTNITCYQEKDVKTLIYINDGKVGVLNRGKDYGIVNKLGQLFIRHPAGSWKDFEGTVTPGELYYEGQLSDAQGAGKYIAAYSGSTVGCNGSFHAQRVDFINEITTEKGRLFSEAFIQYGSKFINGSVWLLDGNNVGQSSILLKTEDNSLLCAGSWINTTKDMRRADWDLYCGEQNLISGKWNIQGQRWTTTGVDGDGVKFTVTGQTKGLNKYSSYIFKKDFRKKAESNARVKDKRKTGGSNTVLVSCKIGYKSPIITSTKSCFEAKGKILDGNTPSS